MSPHRSLDEQIATEAEMPVHSTPVLWTTELYTGNAVIADHPDNDQR